MDEDKYCIVMSIVNRRTGFLNILATCATREVADAWWAQFALYHDSEECMNLREIMVPCYTNEKELTR